MKNKGHYVILFIASFLIAITMYYYINFNDSIFEQLYYSLLYSEGTGVSSFSSIILIVSALTIGIFTLIFILFILKDKIKFKNNKISIGNFSLSIIVLIISLLFAISRLNVLEYLINQFDESSFYEDNYVNPKNVEIIFPEEKNNLIYIYLESFESGLVSLENGGYHQTKVIPHLENIALNNVNFSFNDLIGGADVLEGNSWTMAAMLGHTSGITMNLPVGQEAYSKENGYMSDLYTIGDILHDNGYNNYLMVGSDGDFAGRKDYFEEHGNYEVFDYYKAIEENKINEDYYVWWGFEDNKLIEYAKEKIIDLSNLEEPFNFTMLTVDTHFPDGYEDETCPSVFEDPYLNSFNCSDSKINEFINWISLQPFFENTTVVIVGDHNSMQKIDEHVEHKVFNSFINPVNDIDSKNREFNTLDLFPTTLGALGVSIEGNKLGLGTNLFSYEETLTEKYGYDYLNRELQRKSNFYSEEFLTE